MSIPVISAHQRCMCGLLVTSASGIYLRIVISPVSRPLRNLSNKVLLHILASSISAAFKEGSILIRSFFHCFCMDPALLQRKASRQATSEVHIGRIGYLVLQWHSRTSVMPPATRLECSALREWSPGSLSGQTFKTGFSPPHDLLPIR